MTNFNASNEQIEDLAESFRKFGRTFGTSLKEIQDSMYKVANKLFDDFIIYEDETYTIYETEEQIIVTKEVDEHTITTSLGDLPESIRNEVSKEVL